MYPEKLEFEKHRYFSENEYFKGKFNYIHTYLHTDYRFRMHSHQFYEINIITEGCGKHYIANSVLDTSVGDFFVIPPGINHGYYSENRINIYHMLIKTEFFSRYGEELEHINGFDLLFDIEPRIRCAAGINFNLGDGAHMSSAFREELDRMAAAEMGGNYVYLNALAVAFICRLCERISGAVTESCEMDIINVMEYVKNNLDSHLTLDTLAETAHMSPSTLNRRFAAATGQPPMKYVLSCRIAKAEKLISESSISRTEAAQICGFYDISHMNKYIKSK